MGWQISEIVLAAAATLNSFVNRIANRALIELTDINRFPRPP